MFTFWSGLSIGIVLGVVLWNAGVRLGNAMVGTPSASHNTTKAKIYQDISESIYKFIYENEDTPVIDPDSLKGEMVSIIADKLSALCGTLFYIFFFNLL